MKIDIKGYTVLIDKEDEDRIKQHPWRVCSKELKQGLYYFHSMSSRKIKPRKNYRLHRFIMNAPSGTIVDHINRNTLDCRKKNLRICTALVNARNRTPHSKKPKKYTRLNRGYKVALCKVHLGYYKTPKEAWEIKDIFSILLYGSAYALHYPKNINRYKAILADVEKLENVLCLRRKKETIARLLYMRRHNKSTKWVIAHRL
jgi:hypothetical protein